MLPASESIPEDGVFSSLSSTSSSLISDHCSQTDKNNNRLENRAAIDILKIDLLCDESFSQIMKEEEEKEDEEVISDTSFKEVVSDTSSKEVVISDAFSTNCIIFALNKRKRSCYDEEKDRNATYTICDANKLRRIHEEKRKQKEHNGQNKNQESKLDDEEEEDGNQENTNGEEEKKEKDVNEESKEEEEGKKEEMDEDQNEKGKI